MDEHGPDAPEEGSTPLLRTYKALRKRDDAAVNAANQGRKYLPTLSDLVDRLTIVQMKMIFIKDHRSEYVVEREAILHDIDLLLRDLPNGLTARAVWAITVVQLANRFVWENETKIRDGSSDESPEIQLERLKATHAINGVRNSAKNVLAELVAGSRVDYKIDCMASDLPEQFGCWDIF
jgi:hypothetical protein